MFWAYLHLAHPTGGKSAKTVPSPDGRLVVDYGSTARLRFQPLGGMVASSPGASSNPAKASPTMPSMRRTSSSRNCLNSPSRRLLDSDATSIRILLELAVVRGDYLRLGLTTSNTGPGGGDNPQAAFPNGRRPNDDVIDTIVTLLNNRQVLGDSVSGNDVVNLNSFPFFAPPHQPFPPGTIDDGTRH